MMGRGTCNITRVLRSTIVIALLMIAILGDLYCVASRAGSSDRDGFVLRSLAWKLGVAYVSQGSVVGLGYIDRNGEPVICTLDDVPECRNEANRTGAIQYTLEYRAWTDRSGFWAATREVRRARLTVRSEGGGVYQPHLDELLPAFLDTHPTLNREDAWAQRAGVRDALLATGRVDQARTLYSGHAHNALSIVMVALLGLAMRLRFVHFRENRRLARDLCPTCKYDLRGLDSGVCPECGASIPEQA